MLYVFICNRADFGQGEKNNIQCMYVADDNYITELQNKQNQNQELYSGSRLANGDRFIPVGMEINSGDELVICCEELEVI